MAKRNLRSSRRALQAQPMRDAEVFMGKSDREGLEVKHIDKYIGCGVFTTKNFKKGEFLLEYIGELITRKEALMREKTYKASQGSFMFFFHDCHGPKCIDATSSSGMGRLINDATGTAVNCKVKVVNGRLGVFAVKDIHKGIELRFDYGIPDLPWRKKKTRSKRAVTVEDYSCNNAQSAEDYLSTLTFCGLRQEFSEEPSRGNQTSHAVSGFPKPDHGNDPDVGMEDEQCEIEEDGLADAAGSEAPAEATATAACSEAPPESTAACSEAPAEATATVACSEAPPEPTAACSEAPAEATAAAGACSEVPSEATAASSEAPAAAALGNSEAPAEATRATAACSEAAEATEAAGSEAPAEAATGSEAPAGPAGSSEAPAEATTATAACSEAPPEVTAASLGAPAAAAPGSSEAPAGAAGSSEAPAEPATGLEAPSEAAAGGSGAPAGAAAYSSEAPPEATAGSSEAPAEATTATAACSEAAEATEAAEAAEAAGSEAPAEVYFPASSGYSSDPRYGGAVSAQSNQSAFVDESSDEYENENDPDFIPSFSDDSDIVADSSDDSSSRPSSPIIPLLPRTNWRRNESPQPPAQQFNSTSKPAVDLQSNVVSSSFQIEVQTTSNCEGRRKWDKSQYCPFCLEEQKKLPRHLLTPMHKHEPQVKAWIATEDKQEKMKQLTLMRNYGNFLHNSSVLQKGSGKLIVVYRPTYDVNPEDYLPCQHCYGFFSKSDLWKHKCSQNPTEDKSNEPCKKKKRVLHCKPARMLLPCTQGTGQRTNEILSKLTTDHVSRIIKSDSLIKKFAEKLTRKHGHSRDQEGYIRQRLREVARMVLEFRTLNEDANATLTSLMCPQKFVSVVNATKVAAGFNAETNLYTTPSLALKIGHSLKTCCEILHGEALISGDERVENHCKAFQALYSSQWDDRISHHALRSLQESKRNNPKLLPLTDDIVKLSKYLKDEVKSREQTLRNTSESEEIQKTWQKLCEVLLTQVIVFNRKRPGEVSKMSVGDYRKCTNGEGSILDTALTVWEKQLCKVLWRVEIIGKRSVTVAVLLTAAMKHALDTLTTRRSDAGIDDDNTYLFASRYGLGHIRGTDTVRDHANLCKAKQPAYLRATRLRKHIATVSQIMNLQENELDLLASFLGHDIRTHRQYYRLPEETLQLAKVSKVLLKMERGDIKELSGRSLEDIKVNPNEEYDTDAESDQSEDEQAEEPEDKDESPAGADEDIQMKGVTKMTRKPWNSKEKQAVAKHLSGYLRSRTVPGKNAIMVLFKAEGKLFEGRSWRNIKDFVRNQARKKDPMAFLKT